MGFWVGIDILGEGDFFRWDLKTPCIEISNKFQKKKKRFWLFFSTFGPVPYLNNFLLVEYTFVFCVSYVRAWEICFMLHMCMLTYFSHFYLGIFCPSVHWNSQKSVYYCVKITLWNCECCLIWAQNKSIMHDIYCVMI